MGSGQHRNRGIAVRHLGQLVDDLLHLRMDYLVTQLLEHQRIGQVVDVLGSAGKMQEFADPGQFAVVCNPFLEKVLNRFYVMIGSRLNGLDSLCIGQTKLINDCVEGLFGGVCECRHLRDVRVSRQHLQPANLDDCAVMNQAVFAESQADLVYFACVSAINGADRGQGVVFHRWVLWQKWTMILRSGPQSVRCIL